MQLLRAKPVSKYGFQYQILTEHSILECNLLINKIVNLNTVNTVFESKAY